MQKVLFVDRDGALLVRPSDGSAIKCLEQLVFVPGTISALKRLANAGWTPVMLNARGALETPADPSKTFDLVNRKLFEILASEGIDFLAIYEDNSTVFDLATVGKPTMGNVNDFLRQNSIDLSTSVMIGDGEADMNFATENGIPKYLLDDSDWPAVADEIVNAPRKATVTRKTSETDITISINLDGRGKTSVNTGLRFFDHMLEQLGKHGNFDINIDCNGDLDIDEHHTIEDVAIALGDGFKLALGDKFGIERYASDKIIVMDEAKCEVALDLSGRAFLVYDANLTREYVGDFPTEMLEHFLYSFSQQIGMSLHLSLSGKNHHHIIEVAFKGLSKALKTAVLRTSNGIPSTKGVL